MVKDFLSSLVSNHQEHLKDDENRQYIGASAIGSDCARKIWYEFKGFESQGVPSKTRRTWAVGKRLEGLVIEWLEESGAKIITTDETFHSEAVPFFQGHIDGILSLKNNDFILEIKTAKDASFNIFTKKGVMGWNKQYYSQLQSYMGMSGIHRSYIIVLNKDNSELSDELVLFDEGYYRQLEDRALIISLCEEEPRKINNSPMFFMCKMCKYNKVCHG